MSEETAVSNKRNNRKRKKSFLKNARKYAKQGHYGRGSEMDSDTYQYFVRIMEAYREGFDSEEDKVVFVNNVFEQTEDQEVNYSCNQVGCRVIEMLLPFANDAVFERFMKAFGADLRPLCSDRFATHVLEALVTQSCERSLKTKGISEEMRESYKEFTTKISRFLLNNMEDYIWDTYGNHVIRKCLESLAHIPTEDTNKPNKKPEIKVEDGNVNMPSEYTEIVKDYGERLITWPQFSELCNSELTSGFLQVLLRALKRVDSNLLKRYLQKFLSETFAPENADSQGDSNILPAAFMSKSVMMLLETSIQVAKRKMFTQIYAKCFVGRLAKLATTRSTNFAVQKLLNHCTEKVEFEAMFDELVEHLQEIIEIGHTGVVLALAQACKRLSAKQGSFVQGLMKSLGCAEPEEKQQHIVVCLSRFSSYEKVQTSNGNLQSDKLNLHGTLILQLILEFNKPIKIVSSILGMDASELKNLFSNTMGSHIVDSYVNSSFVGEKSREKLVRKMKGYYQELASSKFGSRSFEAIWKAANLKNRLLIMDELCYKDAAWSNTQHGKIIASKLNLTLYKRNKEDWKNSLSKVNDKSEKDFFADVLN